ncbi:phosphoribosyl-ATP diphosphatase [Bartonella sp. M0177]|uniref:phosphoribosyl-ATP diphosphatase n=1 Tax=Bartonella TaxID=773 RepID=UPI00098EBAD8|nr:MULTISPECIES: phosphoribosyl-ATP diphosphatase [Bartonella]AQT43824.1 phosphoribosyl-ATP pyrophosphatase [Bartonella apihabitans]MBH9995418.1 phosphoribosyl-ATP diphosphatase [Bartonella sp. P0291]MBH9996238.1 phosphoribosyl-ATP diphosphatase [Bartonella sp. M0192]MBH9998399.1 phosphoribosyl-ATP diphosphatase [Bartonella sp. M0191]MBI0000551.1 phosphoribosyl-ATP diphosphatase [Bartonella sp. W8122]
MTDFSLHSLEDIIAKRAMVDDGSSYTASLVQKGMGRAAKKMGEEAVETVIAALNEDDKHFISESADLIYHLLVMWHIRGIKLDDVVKELARRTAQSGLEEKASRKNG